MREEVSGIEINGMAISSHHPDAPGKGGPGRGYNSFRILCLILDPMVK
jgi:hypothetical protein